MCGICGFAAATTRPSALDTLRRMAATIHHRGPDKDGYFYTDGAALGFRRLSIIDLNTGDQPMPNNDGSIQIIFNGEIYNFQALRDELRGRGYVFRTRSDTETILHAYEEWGEGCVEHFRGMFAFAIWDARQRRIFIARDPLGKKPVYYYHKGGLFAFASEIKALVELPEIPREIDPASIGTYLRWGYIPAPYSILADVAKLPPAHTLIYDVDTDALALRRYWAPHYEPKQTLSFEDASRQLRALLTEAVKLRMISDVPLGALLSGGVDSSTIVALMAEHSSHPVQTFSIGFEEEAFDELPYARQVAHRFNTDHHEMVVRPNAMEVLPDLVWYLDEPMADASAVPSYYVSKMARRYVTVALNGDGGDEAFGGYRSYAAILRYRRYLTLPAPLRQRMIEPALRALPGGERGGGVLARARRLVAQSSATLEAQFTRWMEITHPPTLKTLYPSGAEHPLTHPAFAHDEETLGALDWMMRHDTFNYLPGDLLVKMDRMSMGNSLEARSPLLDKEVVAFAASLPEAYKNDGRTGKRILKHAMRDLLPADVLNRKKQGFGVPVGRWLRGELKDAGAELLLGGGRHTADYLDGETVARLWAEHQNREHDHANTLWSLIILEMWSARFLDGDA
ncbi:MAG TPA: asparagine synthase (glutamine-hydrolyzing) [Aggregatilineales bacterium]|nr:asparagine synthase (glutamine-hydrolyzing) [Anaerolineales bacterium]HRE46495.1 asparagine synthase (glutamine-hydrolyzing) [Aggregatilineales bacterium]